MARPPAFTNETRLAKAFVWINASAITSVCGGAAAATPMRDQRRAGSQCPTVARAAEPAIKTRDVLQQGVSGQVLGQREVRGKLRWPQVQRQVAAAHDSSAQAGNAIGREAVRRDDDS